MNRRSISAGDELWSLDVVNQFWYPPVPIEPFLFPSGQVELLTGLGFRSGGFGGGTLFGVTRNIADAPPSHILQFLIQPGFPEPPLVGPEFGVLPPGLAAQGADVDPATGDLWIAVDERVGQQIVGRHLVRTDLAGAVLERLTPAARSTYVDPRRRLRRRRDVHCGQKFA